MIGKRSISTEVPALRDSLSWDTNLCVCDIATTHTHTHAPVTQYLLQGGPTTPTPELDLFSKLSVTCVASIGELTARLNARGILVVFQISGMAARSIRVVKLGVMSYSRALKVQEYFARQHLENVSMDPNGISRNVILIVEHNPVYTIGIRTKHYTLKDEERLRKLGADFFQTNRGGLITFHGEGQLVAYPILNLKNFGMGMRKYIETLEDAVINTCRHFKVEARRTTDTGIWVGDRKICALGKLEGLLRHATCH